jgi:hypothetical protein
LLAGLSPHALPDEQPKRRLIVNRSLRPGLSSTNGAFRMVRHSSFACEAAFQIIRIRR